MFIEHPLDFGDKLVLYYKSLTDRDKKLMQGGFFIVPIFLILIMEIFSINYALKYTIMSLVISIMALIYAFSIFIWIMQKDGGTPEMQEIAISITEGSEGFFVSQYGTIFKLTGIFATGIVLMYFTRTTHQDELDKTIGPFAMAIFSGISFVAGSFCSALSGYAGMWVSVRSNVRVASAARRCYNEALEIAFKGGYFAAAINVALAIFGISFLFLLMMCYLTFNQSPTVTLRAIDKIPMLIIGFGFGASFVAMFAQLGGGIYTKAADVGADLIGKVEQGIPEDDPRNPAVIADLVGDNVGDCAGQAADLFESISAEIISAMILGLPDYDASYGRIEDPLDVMKRGYRVSMTIGIAGFFLICYFFLNSTKYPKAWLCFSFCGVIGAIVSFLFIEITQYYTDYQHKPVKKIVYSSRTGAATNIIAGLAVGMESTGLPVLLIVIGILSAYYLGESSGIANENGVLIGGLFGTAIATMGMFTTGVFILSMSGFGPIADNAGGIVEMSHQPENVRVITDRLDAVGNVTKANTKGYSVGSASLACFLLFSAFIDEVNFISEKKFEIVDITVPEIFLGGLLGGATVFMFSSYAISAVGNAAQDVINEVRNQFRENPGIMNNTVKPNYKQCVEIVSKAGLREMIKPGLLAVLSPIVVGVTFRIIGVVRGKELLGAKVVCSFLMFATSTGILMALFLNNAGGAWDNAKKFIETGAVGGKGSDIHKAAVVGDTVGDPCKDTAGPSIHILIKLLATITLVLAPIFVEK